MSSQFALLNTRRFAPFFATQFLGAFNDNLFKNALIVLLTFQAVNWTTLAPEVLTNLAAGIFILPFFLFSATAGQLADKYDKAKLARLVKLLEIVIMGVALFGFSTHSLAVLLSALFLLGLHSSLFGPVKYAILPQHLREDELVGGNALVEAGTFVAILIGTLAGGLLAGVAGHPGWVAIAGLVIAVLGYLCSRGIPAAPAPVPELVVSLNPLSETWRNIGFARQNRTVFLSILGISWFWLYGALFLAQFPAYAKNVLGGSETSVTLLLAIFTIGIGFGSLLCERLSAGHVEIGLVPFGSIGLTLFGIDLAFASPALLPIGAPLSLANLLALHHTWRVLFDLFALGLFGGFFIVPLYALIQLRSAPEQRARIIAANNILNALFMVCGALAAAGLLGDGLSIPALFGVAALCNAVVAVYIYSLVPEFMLRFIAWLLVHSVYRLQQRGLQNIPEEGAAVLVCNHVSFVDPIVIAAASRRPIRFVMDYRIYRMPVISLIFRHMRAIPIAPARDDAVMMEAAFEEVASALAAGELVAIFPEGRITDSGDLYPFRPGVQRIVGRTPVPIIPMALQGLWGSFFSRKDGPAMSKPLRRGLFSKIALVVGTAVAPAAATPEHLQEIVAGLRGDWK
ncbi:MAG TPA: MFS transporter [Accumulibacter sp.]|uniref:Lysophospholipid transporter LplT n=2 Tax=Candidatus Accumulibacter TaxID=327159 RepID=A0A080MI84_9PROT|nr:MULTISPECIES: MFS transporter [Candidatus Accumulibacter]KFB76974.1 MAG: Lysophospholipid transporter LplT [Candidatus Accumulibacter cognatus]MBO3711880.1 MFS transporter [Accumulibacter sp.]MCM8579661.1 MFS transporter [Accumulibacter sp.]MCM8623364.1 MFS transporter [Accumulibacter sp.]QLH48610.1 MAG: MFS transporter [Candidatus Accumulibacter cognatus]